MLFRASRLWLQSLARAFKIILPVLTFSVKPKSSFSKVRLVCAQALALIFASRKVDSFHPYKEWKHWLLKWASLTGHSSSFRLNATEADEHFRQHWLKNKLYPSFMIVKPKMLIKCGWRLGLILTSAPVNVMKNTPSSKTSQPGQRAADVATLLAQQKCPWGLKLSLDVTSSNEQSFWESSIEQRGLLHRSEFLSLSWKTSVHHDIENRCWFRFQIFFLFLDTTWIILKRFTPNCTAIGPLIDFEVQL